MHYTIHVYKLILSDNGIFCVAVTPTGSPLGYEQMAKRNELILFGPSNPLMDR
jgi:hypothetical protein